MDANGPDRSFPFQYPPSRTAHAGGQVGGPGRIRPTRAMSFAELLGVSLATVRKWERGTGGPSGAAKTLLAVARLHPEAVREAVAVGK